VCVRGHLTEPGGLSDAYRLLLEDVCSDLVRFLHSRGDPTRFGGVVIDREWSLGPPGVFADLRVAPEGEPPYYLEVKYGYDSATLLSHLHRKYGALTDADGAARLVLVVHTAEHPDWSALEARLCTCLSPQLALEIWDEHRLQHLIAECFEQTTLSLAETELVTVRERIDQGKEHIAFGDAPPAGYGEQVLRQSLLWHFGTWRLAELRHGRSGADLRQLVPPGVYERVVVVMADLSHFSRYVRDTPDDTIVRQILTDFYAKSRYQVINAGGMLSQFVGDQVIALFAHRLSTAGHRRIGLPQLAAAHRSRGAARRRAHQHGDGARPARFDAAAGLRAPADDRRLPADLLASASPG
jgi:hypothetical protein